MVEAVQPLRRVVGVQAAEARAEQAQLQQQEQQTLAVEEADAVGVTPVRAARAAQAL